MGKRVDVRGVLLAQAAAIPEDRVAVLLSAGIDSTAVMLSLLEVGKRVTAYSFVLEGRASTDCLGARAIAERFKVPFRTVILPADIGALKFDCLRMAQDFGCTKKTQFECFWPMLYAYPAVGETVVASGMGADGHFCISKKGMLHWRDRIDEFRLGMYRNPDYAQRPQHEKLASALGKRCWLPFLTRPMQEQFLGSSWEDVNKPRQKQPILDAFPDQFRKIKVRPHVNLRLGDSGIAEHFEKLLGTSWNRTGARSVVAIYNALAAGRIAA